MKDDFRTFHFTPADPTVAEDSEAIDVGSLRSGMLQAVATGDRIGSTRIQYSNDGLNWSADVLGAVVSNDPADLFPDVDAAEDTTIPSRYVRLSFVAAASTNGTYTAILHLK